MTSRTPLSTLLPRRGRPLVALTALLGLVGLPLLMAAVVDLEGAWLVGLGIGAVLTVQVVLLGALHGVAGRLAVNDRHVGAGTETVVTLLKARTDGLRESVEKNAIRTTDLVRGAVADSAKAERAELHRVRAAALDEVQKMLTAENVGTTRQTQALLQLFDAVRIERPLPGLSGFAASPDLLLYLVDLLRTRRPATVLEFGSGSSTLLMGLVAKQYGLPTRIISVDHDAYYGGQTQRTLEEAGVADVAEVRIAPLVDSPVAGHEPQWYDAAAIGDLPPIDLMIVDGPPGSGGPEARYPAFPVMRDRLAPGALVLMDDYDRSDERITGERWAESEPGATIERVDLYKGLGVLRMP